MMAHVQAHLFGVHVEFLLPVREQFALLYCLTAGKATLNKNKLKSNKNDWDHIIR